MFKLSDVKMRPKLIGIFLLIGIIPLAIAGWYSIWLSKDEMMKSSFNQLESMREVKKNQIQSFFAERKHNMQTLTNTVEKIKQNAFAKLSSVQQLKSEQIKEFFNGVKQDTKLLSKSEDIKQAYNSFQRYHDEMGFGANEAYNVDTSQYKDIWAQYKDSLGKYVTDLGYYDVFLICKQHGHVMYTHARENDIGTNLGNGKYQDEGLAKLWKKVVKKDEVIVQDFSYYAPSGEQAAFVGAPVRNAAGETIAVTALQIPKEKINHIVQQRQGLGKTGETFLAAEQNDSIRFRSDLQTMGGGEFVVGYDFTDSAPAYLSEVLEGKKVRDIYTDSTGNPVIVTGDLMDLGNGVKWAMITKQNLEEALTSASKSGQSDYFAQYIDKNNYYDLFLMNKKGDVFYTVAQEADYKTNMVDGKYADSNLGKLTRKVLEQREYAVADFAPYAPSDGKPAGFVANPIIDKHGDLILIVAAQLSLDAINSIMQERTGMGETGETYLVGADKRMRSDSYLDPQGHSVQASFAGTVQQNGVDTLAVQEIFQGKTDSEIIQDYNGNPVLSAYTPVKITDDLTWGLLAEINKSEVMAPINNLIISIVIVGLIIAVIIALIAYFVGDTISKPLVRGVDFAQNVAEGDLTQTLDIDQKDEVGQLAQALNNMTKNLNQIIKDQSEGIETLASSSSELTSIADQMSSSSEDTVSKVNTVASSAEEMSTNMSSVASAMEQASTNVNTIVSGAEEMSSSINEIAKSAEQARETTSNAVNQADSASKRMNELGEAAQSIGKVTETINAISSQTNLLALNATIEAARAGEAGKGFAVVANEIKELAQQTADATGDISKKIEDIQSTTDMSVNEIKEVIDVINRVEEFVSSIASSMEEQSSTTKEIASNVSQVSQGIQEVNENVNQSSQAAGQVSKDVNEVNKTANEISNSSAQVQESAQELSKLAERLREMAGKFKI